MLRNQQVNPTVIELDTLESGTDIARELELMTGQSLLPNIFIGGKHIGDNTHLKQIQDQGNLRNLLFSARAFKNQLVPVK